MIRDQALAASGLLVERVGGPSVRPYQPPGLWKDLNGQTYKPDSGPGLYRRSLYTFWKRTVAPPAMVAFDASTRETCTVRETRTNTPLQALNLLNDVTYIEASRKLAERGAQDARVEPVRTDRAGISPRLVAAADRGGGPHSSAQLRPASGRLPRRPGFCERSSLQSASRPATTVSTPPSWQPTPRRPA